MGGVIELLIVSVVWAFSFGLIKGVLAGVDPNLVAFLRLALAGAVFAPLLRRDVPEPATRARFVLLGALQFGVMYVAYMASYRFLLSYQVALFTIVTPLYVTLIHDLLARRLSVRFHLAALLAVGGAAVIAWPDRGDPLVLRGVLLLQVANLAFAAGQVLYKRMRAARPDVDDPRILGWMYLGGAAVCAAATAVTLPRGGWRLSGPQGAAVLYLGLVASGLCFFLWNRGVTRVNAGTLAAFNNGYIPLAVLFSLLLWREPADPGRLAIGTGFLLAAVLVNGRRP